MILISYDISNDKKRRIFSQYLKKFGHRLQYSVFEIDNSERVLKNIYSDIQNKFEKSFEQTDSIYIFKLSNSCEVVKFGYARNEEKDIIIIR